MPKHIKDVIRAIKFFNKILSKIHLSNWLISNKFFSIDSIKCSSLEHLHLAVYTIFYANTATILETLYYMYTKKALKNRNTYDVT